MKPGGSGVGVLQHGGLLEIGVDGAVDPREDCTVHLHPRWPIVVDHIGEDVIREGILAQDDEKKRAPSVVVVGDAIKDHRDEHLDVEDSDGGGMNICVPGFVVLKSSGARCVGLGLTAGNFSFTFAALVLLASTTFGLVGATLVLLAGAAFSVRFGHGSRQRSAAAWRRPASRVLSDGAACLVVRTGGG
jgi:hypothetical protein